MKNLFFTKFNLPEKLVFSEKGTGEFPHFNIGGCMK